MSTRILIVDDHGVLRAGLRALLSADPEFQVIGEAADGLHAIDMACQMGADIILLDISMPGANGIEVCRQIKLKMPDSRVLILTVHEDESLLREAIQAGASGYIVKRAIASELLNAIGAVRRGELYVHPAMTRALLKGISSSTTDEPPAESLTPREVDVLRLIAQGHTNRQIAQVLNLSVRTVETHRANLMAKLDLHTRVELVHYAIEHNLLD